MAYDLEEQESLDQLKAWWDKWGTPTLSVITVCCLAFAAWNGWNWYQRYQGNKATDIYIQLQNAYMQGDEKNIQSLANGLIKEYPGHAFASYAAFIQAAQAGTKNDVPAARAALVWVIEKSGHPEFDLIARVRLAGVELDAKNPQKALTLLQGLQPLPEQKAQYYDRLGDVYFAMNEQSKARDAWQNGLKAGAQDAGNLNAVMSVKLLSLPNEK